MALDLQRFNPFARTTVETHPIIELVPEPQFAENDPVTVTISADFWTPCHQLRGVVLSVTDTHATVEVVAAVRDGFAWVDEVTVPLSALTRRELTPVPPYRTYVDFEAGDVIRTCETRRIGYVAWRNANIVEVVLRDGTRGFCEARAVELVSFGW